MIINSKDFFSKLTEKHEQIFLCFITTYPRMGEKSLLKEQGIWFDKVLSYFSSESELFASRLLWREMAIWSIENNNRDLIRNISSILQKERSDLFESRFVGKHFSNSISFKDYDSLDPGVFQYKKKVEISPELIRLIDGEYSDKDTYN